MMKTLSPISPGNFARGLSLVLTVVLLGLPCVAQVLQPALSVNGNPLVTARPVTRIGQEWFLPLIPIAEALGIDVSISADSMSLRAQRRDGTEVAYDGRTGEIRSGYVLVGHVKNYRQVQLAGSREEVLFPLSGIVALLGVDIEEDSTRGILLIDGTRQALQGQAPAPPAVTVTNLSYDYGLTTNIRDYSQFLSLRGGGMTRIAGLKGNVLLSRYPGQPVFSFNQGTLEMDFSRARKLFLGDQGAYSGIDALTNILRGVGIERPLKRYQFSLYGGQSVSATFASLGGSFRRYDTSIAGFALRKKSKTEELSFGGHFFTGADRTGSAVGVAYGRTSARNQFKAQVLFGQFSGLSARNMPVSSNQAFPNELGAGRSAGAIGRVDIGQAGDSGAAIPLDSPAPVFTPVRVNGPALGLTINNIFTPMRQLSISGQFDRYGANFLTPRQEPRYQGQSNAALSVVFRPNRYASFTAGISRREYLVGMPGTLQGQTFGALATLPGRRTFQFGFFRSVHADSSSRLGKTALTQLSFAMPNLSRYSAYAYYSEMEFGGRRAGQLNAVFAIDLKSRGRITISEQRQIGSSHRFGLDWHLDLPKNNGFIRVGIDRVREINTSASYHPMVGLRLPLTNGHSLQLTYLADRDTKTFRVEIGGRLIREPERTSPAAGPRSIMQLTRISGRVFLDTNMNRTFDETVDRPIAGVQIWLDGTQAAASDARGLFRFEQVTPGAHTVNASLDGLPADMVFADAPEKTVAVLSYRENILNFSVLRTGRITGRVTCLEYRGASEMPVERALPDVRIVTSSRYDALSEINGMFLLGDLPPGDYELKLDRATLPSGYVAKTDPIRVVVKPGETATDVTFRLAIPPKPIIQKILSPQTEKPPGPGSPPSDVIKGDPGKVHQNELQSSGISRPSVAASKGPLPVAPPPVSTASRYRNEIKPALNVPPLRKGAKPASERPPVLRSTQPSELPAAASGAQATGRFQVQVIAARTRKEAEQQVKRFRQLGFSCHIWRVQIKGRGTWYRVRLAGYGSRHSALTAAKKLLAEGVIKEYWVV
jgi:cell division protein FtsN